MSEFIGRKFIDSLGANETNTSSEVFVINKAQNGYAVVVWSGGEIETDWVEVKSNIKGGIWVLLASDEQLKWLDVMAKRKDLTWDEHWIVKAVLKRGMHYYSYTERNQLNKIREKYK